VREERGRIAELVVGRGRVRATMKELKQQQECANCSVSCSSLLCRTARSAFSIYRLQSSVAEEVRRCTWTHGLRGSPALGSRRRDQNKTIDMLSTDRSDGSAHVLINHSDRNAAGACITHYFHVIFVHMYSTCTPRKP
jgi:hypothetical protein